MVGILIALQIQNWNQQRLDRIEERYLLEELVDNLNQEAERLEFGIELQGKQLQDFGEIREYFGGKSANEDEFQNKLAWLIAIFGFNPVSSAYDTMKGGGIGFSSRELKAELVQYYEVEQALLIGTLSRQEGIISQQVEPLFAKYIKFLDYGNDSGPRAIPKNIDDRIFQEAILGQIVLLAPNVNLARERSKTLMEKNREILALVEQELEGM